MAPPTRRPTSVLRSAEGDLHAPLHAPIEADTPLTDGRIRGAAPTARPQAAFGALSGLQARPVAGGGPQAREPRPPPRGPPGPAAGGSWSACVWCPGAFPGRFARPARPCAAAPASDTS